MRWNIKIYRKFIKNCKNARTGYILEVDLKYLEQLGLLQNDLPFILMKMKISKQEKLTCNLNSKEGYIVHSRNLHQDPYHSLKLGKVHRVIKVDQKIVKII